jgi:ABC-type dipeptide/oligopeptide/nickel transport system permease component
MRNLWPDLCSDFTLNSLYSVPPFVISFFLIIIIYFELASPILHSRPNYKEWQRFISKKLFKGVCYSIGICATESFSFQSALPPIKVTALNNGEGFI